MTKTLTNKDLKEYRWITHADMVNHNPIAVIRVVEGDTFRNVYFITVN